jgi:hypothetical protein
VVLSIAASPRTDGTKRLNARAEWSPSSIVDRAVDERPWHGSGCRGSSPLNFVVKFFAVRFFAVHSAPSIS